MPLHAQQPAGGSWHGNRLDRAVRRALPRPPGRAQAGRSPGRAASSPGSSWRPGCARGCRSPRSDALDRSASRCGPSPPRWSCRPSWTWTRWISVPPRATFSSWMPRQIASTGMPLRIAARISGRVVWSRSRSWKSGVSMSPPFVVAGMHVAGAAGNEQAGQRIEQVQHGLAQRRDQDGQRAGTAQHGLRVAGRSLVERHVVQGFGAGGDANDHSAACLRSGLGRNRSAMTAPSMPQNIIAAIPRGVPSVSRPTSRPELAPRLNWNVPISAEALPA